MTTNHEINENDNPATDSASVTTNESNTVLSAIADTRIKEQLPAMTIAMYAGHTAGS